MTDTILISAAIVGIVFSFASGFYIGRMSAPKSKVEKLPWWYEPIKKVAPNAVRVTIDFQKMKLWTKQNLSS